MSYKLSKAAANDLRAIARYSVQNFGTAKAKSYGDSFKTCFDTITDNPHIGRAYEHIRPGLRRHNHKSHAVFYMLQDQGILIVRVLHESQDAPKHL